MAFYTEEEDPWTCAQHLSKRRRPGVCSVCLSDRLAALCPNCANLRPCSCFPASTSSSSSASSSFSLHLPDGISGIGFVGRVSNLIDSEPSFRRSRSTAVFSLFRSARFSRDDQRRENLTPVSNSNNNKSSLFSIFSVFRKQKLKRDEEFVEDIEELKMRRSKLVAASIAAAENGMRSSPVKGKGWYFPSPMKVFRHSKSSKVVQERSPLHRG